MSRYESKNVIYCFVRAPNSKYIIYYFSLYIFNDADYDVRHRCHKKSLLRIDYEQRPKVEHVSMLLGDSHDYFVSAK